MAEEKLSVYIAMKFLKDCFDEHAAKEGEKATLTKGELAEILRKNFDITENHLIVQFFEGMDKDKDAKITWEEYMGYLTHLFIGF